MYRCDINHRDAVCAAFVEYYAEIIKLSIMILCFFIFLLIKRFLIYLLYQRKSKSGVLLITENNLWFEYVFVCYQLGIHYNECIYKLLQKPNFGWGFIDKWL